VKYIATVGSKEIEVEVESRDDGRFLVRVGDREMVADLCAAGGHSLFSLALDHQTYEVAVAQFKDRTRVALRGHDVNLTVESEQERNARLVDAPIAASRAHVVKSVMPGRVSRILVREGEDVDAGVPLLILEAMKMENEIRAAAPGKVASILVAEGQTVGNGEALVTIE